MVEKAEKVVKENKAMILFLKRECKESGFLKRKTKTLVLIDPNCESKQLQDVLKVSSGCSSD